MGKRHSANDNQQAAHNASEQDTDIKSRNQSRKMLEDAETQANAMPLHEEEIGGA